ncbi:hypothetical protein PTKIN_Ptkin04bG0014700 [Pterospermum kingtungense]
MVMEEKAKTSHGLGHEAIRAKHGSNYSRRRSSQGETHASSSSPRQETHGSKRAVLCGILYKNSRNRLEGCVNDVFNIKKLLVNLYGFSDSSIIILTDDQSDPETRPTKRNIMKALNWLVQGVRPQDSLVFHFSGHGSKEGPNLELYPLDYKSVPKQRIVGDELNETIIKPLPQGAKLHVIIDACHSGNGLSLPYRYKPDRLGNLLLRQGNHWDEYPELRRNGIGGTVVCFSACDDDQIAADTREWCCPDAGRYRVNCDGAFESHGEMKKAGTGVVIRDMRQGFWWKGKAKFVHVNTRLVAEAYALKAGMDVAKGRALNSIILESDSEIFIKALEGKKGKLSWKVDPFVKEI